MNTANLVAIVVITLLTVLNTFGVKLGAAVQNVFTSAKVLALLAVVFVGLIAKNAVALAANFGAGWQNFWALGAMGCTGLRSARSGLERMMLRRWSAG